jgi:hypothetical protein
MRWLVHEAQPGDALFFYFAGHSSQREDENARVKGAVDDAIVPVDLPISGVVTSNQAFELMVQNLPEGVRLTALVDTFHPCILLDLPFVYDGEDSWDEDANPFHVLGDVVCFGAQPGARLSPEEKAALQHAPRGPLTTAFIQSLLELGARRRQEYGSPKEAVFDREGCVTVDPTAFGPRSVTYAELFLEIEEHLQRSGHQRRPRLCASQAFDPCARAFRFSGAELNGNEWCGLQAPRLHREPRPR